MRELMAIDKYIDSQEAWQDIEEEDREDDVNITEEEHGVYLQTYSLPPVWEIATDIRGEEWA